MEKAYPDKQGLLQGFAQHSEIVSARSPYPRK
jgi:hypothetical protein